MRKSDPAYRKIANALRKEITSRRLAAHTRLSSEPELSRRFNVARETVRRALDQLQRDGIIYSRRAVGRFVAEPRVEQELTQLFSFTEVMSSKGIQAGTVVLEAGVEKLLSPESPILVGLELKPNARVIRIRRLRLGGTAPLVIANTWLPRSRFPDFLDHDIKHKSVYEIMTTFGYKPTDAVESIEAVTLGTEEAGLLKVAAGSSALLIRRIAFAGKVPVEYAVDYYRGDRTRFRVHLGVEKERPKEDLPSVL
jgi:GntR family transcriptional regulator